MRSLVYRFDNFNDLSLIVEAGSDEQDLELPASCSCRDGEWVLATFEVVDDTASIAACVADRGFGLRLAFQDRDWEELWRFANREGPPSVPPPSVRGAQPNTQLRAPDGATVMVVDDDPDIRQVVRKVLSGIGFKVSDAATAELALDALRDTQPDVLVLDWNLPGMSGVDMCRRLRRDKSALPLVFLTAQSSTEALVQAFDAGADDYVTKPFRAAELEARVLRLVRR